ncbi:amyloid-beta precursor-like protein isoform X3 [Octopus sinensis]|uniref:Amyloid-beta precursor-like protein isoform X3 n=1 Tax=Octopus sinensis TaxID=2607531 RepID=A0A7E6FG52_9MOLL|nr:amyloid-beta precursor-like protein isoform X3 [Octopus sinensis]
MRPVGFVGLWLLAVVSIQAVVVNMDMNARKFEPMVAFLCNKPAMHRTPNGWQADTDDSKSCLSSPVQILSYCKTLYPDHEVTNVLQASYKVTIPNWCRFNATHCHKHGNHTVRPFRCLVGPFQSDALLVPEHCIFDHYHDSRVCNEFDECNKTAMSKCALRQMTTQSFAMLWPCKEPGHFSGVEFVCCPKEHSSDMEEDVETTPSTPASIKKPESSLNDYTAYLKGDSQYLGKYSNEHEKFKAAEKVMQQVEVERNTKMMKEWKNARERVREMKKTDPKQAMQLNKELTERYNKIYKAYGQETILEKKQLIAIHQQRVQSNINVKKRNLMKALQSYLEENHVNVHRIEKTAIAYIRVEQKDRTHAIKHYQHLHDTDPKEASNIRERVIEHLNLIDERIRRMLDWLKRNSAVDRDVRPKVEKFLAKFQGINANSMKYLLHEDPAPEETPAENEKSDDYSDGDDDDDDDDEAVTEIDDKVKPTKAEPDEPEEQQQEQQPEQQQAPQQQQMLEERPPIFDSESIEDERPTYIERPAHEHVQQNRPKYHAHSGQQPFIAEQVSLDHLYNNSPANSVVGIAIGGVAVFIIILVAVVMLRRRSQRQRVTHGFVEVDPAASPEERHVANMQMNGYENPTYRYFEMQNQ